MAPTLMSEVQTLNFTNLSTLRDAARSDLADACCRYGLGREELRAIGELTPQAVIHLVATMGDEAFFVPREDIGILLASPPAVLAVLAAARSRLPPRPAAATNGR